MNLKIAIIISFCLLCVALSPAYGVLAREEPVTVRQPDGTSIELRLRGDEFYHWYEDRSGYPVAQDQATRFWHYARLDARGDLVPGPWVVGHSDPARLALDKTAVSPQRLACANTRRLERDRRPRSAPTTGTIKNLVVLIEFSDMYGQRTPAEFTNLFNQPGYNADGAVGSVQDYFKEVSYQQLTIESTVTPWVRLDNGYAYYGANDGSGNDVRPREMVAQALQKLHDSGFNFAPFDSNSDGDIDSITIIHAGRGEEWSGNNPNYIWSHQWALISPVTYDGVTIWPYHTEPEMRGSDGPPAETRITTIGVICHESGHFLGLPDLYDTDYSSRGVGRWCLMSGGSWGWQNTGVRPTHVCAWGKLALNWLMPRKIHDGTVAIKPSATNKDIIKESGGFPSKQYLLFENKQKLGFDSDTPQNGLCIWRIDDNVVTDNTNEWEGPGNNPTLHYLVALIQADGAWHLEKDQNSGEAADMFTQSGVNFLSKSTAANPNTGYYGTSTSLDYTGVDVTAIQNSVTSPGDMLFTITGTAGGTSHWDSVNTGIVYTRNWRGVWGSAAGDVFVVGDANTRATTPMIIRYDGSTWNTKLSSSTCTALYAVSGRASNAVYAGGTSENLLAYDGSSWSVEHTGAITWRGLATTAARVFAVGDGGNIGVYDGSSWQFQAVSPYANLRGVWGRADNDAIAAGDSGTILRYNGTTWNAMTSNTSEQLNGVWGSGASDVFAIGNNGVILHYNGTAWSAMTSNTSEHLNGVWGSGASDVFAVGNNGAILHYDGQQWKKMVSGTNSVLHAVWGSSNANVYTAGADGTIMRLTAAVTTPTTPSGQTSGGTGQSLTFTSGGAACSEGHSVEYQFDWGDGSWSAWSASISASHSYSTANTYTVKARARCNDENGLLSSWSGGLTVVISATPHTVTTPGKPNGPSYGETGNSLNYTTTGATCSQGHTVHYQFTWGDGNTSSWSDATGDSHSYAQNGTYFVTAQARCSVSTSVISSNSASQSVAITPHAVTTPVKPTGPASGYVGQSLTYTTGIASCSHGHTVHYQFTWGDGNTSSWSDATGDSHSYASANTYNVRTQARCSVLTTVVSANSPTQAVVVTAHTVSDPAAPSGPDNGAQIGQDVHFHGRAQCNQGHDVDYRFEWGDGNTSSWAATSTVSHSYATASTYNVRVQSRCATETTLVSNWSAITALPVVAVHTVSKPVISLLPTEIVLDQTCDVTVTTAAVCNQSHAVEYLYAWGDNTGEWNSASHLVHTYTKAGAYKVVVAARCASDHNVMSTPSTAATVLVRPKTFTISVKNYGLQWQFVGAAGLTRRYAPALVYDNAMWLPLGQSYNSGWSETLCSLRRSLDGNEWQTMSDACSPRSGHTALVFSGKMWLLGGSWQGVWPSPLFASSLDGTTWQQAAFDSKCYGHAASVLDSKMWLLGGIDSSGQYVNTVRSSDGVQWLGSATNAPWAARAWHAVVVHNGRIWLFGGRDGTQNYNDVWYSPDGTNWTRALASAPWAARHAHVALVYDNKIWLLGGNSGLASASARNDIWYSPDGTNWTQATAAATWPARYGHFGVVYNQRMWIGGGRDDEAGIWRSND